MFSLLKGLVTGDKMKVQLSRFLPFAILLVSVNSVQAWSSLPIGNTVIWWAIQAIILILFLKVRHRSYSLWQINIFLYYLCFSAMYGAVFFAEYYWDWKMLVSNLMIFSLPLAVYVYVRPKLLTITLRLWFRYSWIILLLLSPFLLSDAFGRYLVPYAFLALFLGVLDLKSILVVLIAYLVTVVIGIENRSDIIKFSVCIIIGIVGYIILKYPKYKGIIKILSVSFFIAPFVFFILGATGIFNIFKIGNDNNLAEKYTIKTKENGDVTMLSDTRTFLYVEEINSALKNNYWLLGHSIARGYSSISFGAEIDQALDLKRGERQGSETSILNVFNYFGIVGVVLYFLIFVYAAYKAIYKSRNLFIPIVGLYVSFRWLFAWIEDFSRFDLNYLFLWIMIGMCFSPIYRRMTNKQFYHWLKGVYQ